MCTQKLELSSTKSLITFFIQIQDYRMRLFTSPLCSLRSLSDETTTHIFSECNISLALWKEIQNKVKGVLTLPNLNDHDVHLGIWVSVD